MQAERRPMKALPRCGKCGDTDISKLEDGSVRCRTCGLIAANQVLTRRTHIAHAFKQFTGIVVAVVAGEATVAVVLSVFGFKVVGVLGLLRWSAVLDS
ncbi:MAG: hypothetical protein ACT4OI_05875 [Methanobacteriota archaeon]